LVIVDLKMPKMDGIAFLRLLRGNEQTALGRVPVIMVTAEKNEDAQGRALAAGADAFLLKPLNTDRVVEAVNRLLPRA
jgi:CheY-like chemotaxis protein